MLSKDVSEVVHGLKDEQISSWPRNEIIRGEAIQSRGSKIRREVANRLKKNNIESESRHPVLSSPRKGSSDTYSDCGQETHVPLPDA
jgi:hypothetical protein